MTSAPANLIAVRRLLLDHLDIHENSNAYPTDLDPAEVGIVGDPNHRGGYHCGSDRVVTNDYSVVESSRDRTGLTLDAAGLDVGLFAVQAGGRRHDLYSFSTWCVAQCIAETADSRDIREIIYSPDGRTVRRWDRLGRRSTGDDSHLWHTHFSFFRDAIKAGRDQTPLFRRYLTTIGLIPNEEDLVTSQAEFDALLLNAVTRNPAIQQAMRAIPWQYVGGGIPAGYSTLRVLNETYENAKTAAQPNPVTVAIDAAMLAAALADPAFRTAMAEAVADELAKRLIE